MLRRCLPAHRPSPSHPWSQLLWHRQQRSFLFNSTAHNSTGDVKSFHQHKHLPYRPEHVFAVVKDIDAYRLFVPWCVHSRILPPAGTAKVPSNWTACRAELGVGFGPWQERYVSRVSATHHAGIYNVQATADGHGTFRIMETVWTIRPAAVGGGSQVDFRIRFAFRSVLHAQTSGLFFDEVCRKMMQAFEGRLARLYSPVVK